MPLLMEEGATSEKRQNITESNKKLDIFLVTEILFQIKYIYFIADLSTTAGNQCSSADSRLRHTALDWLCISEV